MPSLAQLAKRAVAGKPLLSRWIYQPYADYQFRKRQARLRSSYQAIQKDGQDRQAGATFSIGHEPTILCNLRCTMCYQGDFREDEVGVKELTLEQMIAVYDRVNVFDAKLVGSEIFMRKDIYDLLDYLQGRHIPTSLMTNGTLMDAKGIERLRSYDNIEWIGFSIDGSREIHNAIRRRPYAFDRTVKAIRDTRPHFTVSINSVILKENLNDLTSILHLAKDLGVPFVHYIFEEVYTEDEVRMTHQLLQQEMGWSEGDYEICTNVREGFDYSFEELQAAVEGLKQEGSRIGVYPVFSPDVWSRKLADYYYGTASKNLQLVCAKLATDTPTFRLDHLGNVHHCGVIRKPFGNLLEQSPEEIWNSEEYRRYRQLLMGKKLLPICKRCCKAAYI